MNVERPGFSVARGACVALLAVATLAAACLVAAAADGRPAGAPRAGAGCSAAGLTPGVVGGRPKCLRVGQRCRAALEADYRRSALSCRKGRLRARPAKRVRAVPGGRTSRDRPVPLGEAGFVGNGWTVTVSGVNLDATEAMLLADPGNRPPPAGFRYVLVSVTASFGGADSSHLNPSAGLRVSGASGSFYSMFNSYCGTLPAPNLDLENPLVFRGGMVSGYAACWSVPKAEVGSLVMVYQPLFSNARLRTWFALR